MFHARHDDARAEHQPRLGSFVAHHLPARSGVRRAGRLQSRPGTPDMTCRLRRAAATIGDPR